MAATTTHLQINREQAEALIAAVVFRAGMLDRYPLLNYGGADAELSKLDGVRVLLDAAASRIAWQEQNQWHSDIRDRLAANVAYPGEAA